MMRMYLATAAPSPGTPEELTSGECALQGVLRLSGGASLDNDGSVHRVATLLAIRADLGNVADPSWRKH